MARKYHNHTLQTNPLLREEETHSTNSPMTLKQFLSNHLSLPSEIIAKLEMTLSTAQQNMDQIQKQNTNNRSINKQLTNNNIHIALESSVEVTGGLN